MPILLFRFPRSFSAPAQGNPGGGSPCPSGEVLAFDLAAGGQTDMPAAETVG